MMMILSGAWPQATAWPARPGGRGRRPRPGRAPARPAAAEPAPAPAGPQGQAMACARYKDGSLAAEPLVSHNFINGTIEIDTVFFIKDEYRKLQFINNVNGDGPEPQKNHQKGDIAHHHIA